MGLFDFLKNNLKPVPKGTKSDSLTKKSQNKTNLDSIQREVFEFLKPLGFRKKGRTFNRQTEDGIYQIINFQSGQFPVGDYVIPGIRESYYGKFTVNLGVLVRELYDLELHNKPKDFFREYDCQIRERLAFLSFKRDYWWPITDETDIISKEIIEELDVKGIAWFDNFETREKICQNWGNIEGSALRAKLDVALIILQQNKEKGKQLIQEYYDSIDSHQGHREYVKELAKRLKVTIN